MGHQIPIHQADRRYASVGLAPDAVVSQVPSWLRAVYGRSGAAQEIQIHDAASTPPNGTAPLLSFPVAVDAPFSIVFPEELPMLNGIYICNSSTVATKTNTGSSNCLFLVTYRKRA